MMTRRRAMMGAGPAPDPGVEYSNFGTAIFKNNKSSGTVSIGCVSYNATTLLAAVVGGNATAGGGTKTHTNLLTDGTHIWINTSGTYSSLTYNGHGVSYKRSSSYLMVTIPSDFDHSIPFEFA